MKPIIGGLTLGLVAIAALLLQRGTHAQDDWARRFQQPPASARPWVYWLIMEVNLEIPRGPVAFMSQQWRRLFKHVVQEAERLGLEITLNTGPGWTGSGARPQLWDP